eukprot:TRINITY_DN4959_c0_g1_i1.p1 TRINITY_DN4959_c0_g1~~TRINITY_DN4959_c0_g1_i1.p1  ORF type:complete len:397 (-),score=39.02 TRINITY_DN4959_c0_g1_i1:296-1438(-)
MSKVVLEENPIENHPRYKKVKLVNSGSFGAVIQAFDSERNKNVAIKFIERGDKVTKNVEREVLNHSVLRHPHIILYHEVFLTEHYVAIVMEFAEGGDMFSFLKKSGGKLAEPQARWFFQQLIFAVEYCHINKVILRDIKLENTLIHWTEDVHPRPILKICDFGYSKHMRSQPKTQVGTLHYAAPEVFQSGDSGYDLHADMWSLGVTLYIMLVGAYPFLREEDKKLKGGMMNNKMIRRILKADYFIPSYIKCSLEVQDLLKHLLVVNPKDRYTIQDVKKHQWFLTNLPSGAIEMNSPKQRENYERKFKCWQSREQIIDILQQARQASDGTFHEAVDERNSYDDMIDELIPQMNSTQLSAQTDTDEQEENSMPLTMEELQDK